MTQGELIDYIRKFLEAGTEPIELTWVGQGIRLINGTFEPALRFTAFVDPLIVSCSRGYLRLSGPVEDIIVVVLAARPALLADMNNDVGTQPHAPGLRKVAAALAALDPLRVLLRSTE